MESEDHECPDCKEKDISPGTLIPNRFLRNSVSNFKNETGYHKRQQYRNAVVQQNQPAPVQDSDTMEIKPKQDVKNDLFVIEYSVNVYTCCPVYRNLSYM